MYVFLCLCLALLFGVARAYICSAFVLTLPHENLGTNRYLFIHKDDELYKS